MKELVLQKTLNNTYCIFIFMMRSGVCVCVCFTAAGPLQLQFLGLDVDRKHHGR